MTSLIRINLSFGLVFMLEVWHERTDERAENYFSYSEMAAAYSLLVHDIVQITTTMPFSHPHHCGSAKLCTIK